LVNGREFQYRYFQRVQVLGKVQYRVYRMLGSGNEEVIKQGFLDMPRIPFVIGELTQSLMSEVADYQIALLNMESSDVYAAIKNNFSFYVEQYDPQAENAYAKIKNADGVDALETDETQQQRSQIHGVAMGRKYPKGLERPSFINPSPEPLSISMEKEDRIRNDIYRLVNLNISMMESKHASEASRKMDYRGLETNLSYIALELQYIDSEIAVVWSLYQNTASAVVKYPNNYELRGTRERREEATSLLKSLGEVTSQPLRKQIVIKAAHLLFNGDLTDSEIRVLIEQLKAEKVILTSDESQTLIEAGVMSRKFFGTQLGLPDNVVKEAMDEHAERAANLVRAQNDAGDAGGDDGEANRQRKQDSQDPDRTDNGTRRTRGKA
jgi:hypothetical protein